MPSSLVAELRVARNFCTFSIAKDSPGAAGYDRGVQMQRARGWATQDLEGNRIEVFALLTRCHLMRGKGWKRSIQQRQTKQGATMI